MKNLTNTDIIALDLEEKILNLHYKPGQIITETEISKKYEISRTPCRDIFQKLKSMGLIEGIPFKSNTISLLNFDIISQSIFMRCAIEKEVLKSFLNMVDEKILLELEYNLKLQELLLETDFKVEEFYKLDCDFHTIWYRATKNMFVLEQINKAQYQYKRFRMLDIVEIKDFKSIVDDHKLLVKYIKEKNYELLEEEILNHLNSGIKRLEKKMETSLAQYFKK